ncbi:MAG TPA: FAD-dependent monooxygenase [Steroidobacteraceae bacterium]|jgi:2-octaprenylphenol hydroxylase|nr:FAD-dependent monooxygenase [Steroidobacteraceae bacterium]
MSGRDPMQPLAGGGADFDVIVVGAGVVGAAMAALLLERGICAPGRVAIVADRIEPPAAARDDWDVRVFALSRASERVLRACGAWASLPPSRVFAFERMRVWDEDGEPLGRSALEFDCAELGEPNLGYIAEGLALQRQCAAGARSAGAVLIEAALESLTVGDARATLRLADGRQLACGLLIGADGQGSRTRELLGIGTAGHAYHQDALVAHVTTSKPHRNTAWQRFLRTGPLAFLPLPDGRSSIVWSANLHEAARLRSLDAAEFADELSRASGEALGRCELSTPLAGFPLKVQYATEYARPRAVLLGDAAHVVHPLAGQGLNLGLLDCAVLAEVLAEARPASGAGELGVLRRYERRRRGENLAAAAALDGFERLFSSSDAWSAGLRGAALRAADRLSPVKSFLARRALGLSGDVPAFLREMQV